MLRVQDRKPKGSQEERRILEQSGVGSQRKEDKEEKAKLL